MSHAAPERETPEHNPHEEYLNVKHGEEWEKIRAGALRKDPYVKRRTKEITELEARADHDGGIPDFLNRKGFTDTLERTLRNLGRLGIGGVLMAFDIDQLKEFNDKWGHIEGDRLIDTYAQVIRKNTRDGDPRGRLGGDEFAVFLVGAGVDAGLEIAERIRLGIIGEVKGTFPNLTDERTVSIGLEVVRSEDTAATLRERADEALYQAKAVRNKTVVYGQE